MEQTVYTQQRQQAYQQILEELKVNAKRRNDFENAITEHIYRWWAQWKPDYEGWLQCADSLYAREAVIDAIGQEPQRYADYRRSMKGQRDAFDMDMGPIQTFVVEGNTVAFNYRMYMTPKMDMGALKKGKTVVLKVSEFNTFDNVDGYEEPMVTHLQLLATGLPNR